MEYILVLGAGSDVGLALARTFARNGFGIYLAGRDLDSMKIAAKDIQIRFSVPADSYYFDAGYLEEHAKFVEELPVAPSIVIYVIGYMGKNQVLENNSKDIQQIISSNYIGGVSILNLFAQKMKTAKSGSLIGISSVAGERGRQSNFLYGSAKAGFTAYLSGLRNALFPFGIHVMTVKPGFIRTKMTEGLKLPPVLTAEPEEVAEAIFKGYKSGKNVLYTRPIWKWIMLVIKIIPESIFKKLSL